MARTKKVVDENIEQVEDVKDVNTNNDLEKENKELKSKLESQENQLNEQANQLNQLTKMIAQLQNQMSMNSSQQQKSDNTFADENVEIVYYGWGQYTLSDKDGAGVITFLDSYEPETIDTLTLKSVMTSNNKNKFFKTGIIGFTDDRIYKIYGMVKPFLLTKENIKSLFEGNYEQIERKLNEVIRGNELVKTTICYQTIRMMGKEELDNIIPIQNVLRRYFGIQNIDTAIASVAWARDLGFIKN